MPHKISNFNLHTHTEQLTIGYLPDAEMTRIMITSGASCPDALVERVIERLVTITGNESYLESIVKEWL